MSTLYYLTEWFTGLLEGETVVYIRESTVTVWRQESDEYCKEVCKVLKYSPTTVVVPNGATTDAGPKP